MARCYWACAPCAPGIHRPTDPDGSSETYGAPSRTSRMRPPLRGTEGTPSMLAYVRKVSHHARDRGASAVEYSLLVAAIAAVLVAVLFGLGTVIHNQLQNTCTSVNHGAVG